MVLNVFSRKDVALTEEAKQFIHSLPATYCNLFRKRRQLFPVWGSHRYCVMIKSTFLLYARISKPDATDMSLEEANASMTNAFSSLKFFNLQNCTIRMLDDDSVGFPFAITPENGKGALHFAADREKDRAAFAQQAAAVQLRAPTVADFETLKLLGKGHYGRVILARSRSDGQMYAVKEMKLNQVKAKVVYTERSVMEWIADFPFILTLDYAFARGKSVFLVSKFMPGGDLFLHMQNHGGCFNEDVVRFYGSELLLALEHMHNMNILHRDIKPENVLLDVDGHIKLADMGLAKKLESRQGRTRTMCGTDTYLPPEMVGRYPGGHGLAVDMWQLGCILFELRAGYPPFYIPQSSQKSTHQRILYQPVRYPNNLSRELKSLLVALLEKKQEDRMGYVHGVAEVKAHAFFRHVNWDHVLHKQIPPPLLPGPAGDSLVNNFDPQFTEQPHDIYVSDELASCYERDFAGFEYVRPSLLVDDTQQHHDHTGVELSPQLSQKDTIGSSSEEEKPEIELDRVMVKF